MSQKMTIIQEFFIISKKFMFTVQDVIKSRENERACNLPSPESLYRRIKQKTNDIIT